MQSLETCQSKSAVSAKFLVYWIRVLKPQRKAALCLDWGSLGRICVFGNLRFKTKTCKYNGGKVRQARGTEICRKQRQPQTNAKIHVCDKTDEKK